MILGATVRRAPLRLTLRSPRTQYAVESVRHWETSPREKKSHDVVFDRLGSLTQSEKMTEGVDLLVAGSDTTAASASTAVLQILQHPDVHKKLVDSLEAAIPSAGHLPTLLELEKIPYLVRFPISSRAVMTVASPADMYFLKAACVKESLRFTSAAPGRLPRVVPATGAPFVVDGQVIPPGVSLSTPTSRNRYRFWCPALHSKSGGFQPRDHKFLTTYMLSTDNCFHVCTYNTHQRRYLGTGRSIL